MTERRNDGMAESRNGGKLPQILKDGIAESRNHGITERRKIPPNPKRRNHGKSSEILKDGIAENQPKSYGSVVDTYTASTAQAYTTSTARDICTLAILCSVFVLWTVFRPCRFTHRLSKLKIHCVCHSLCI